MKSVSVCVLLLLFAVPSVAQEAPQPYDLGGAETWFATFSIVAYDPETDDLGVAVASRPVGAGAAVLWAEAGIGAIATQAGANRTYGPKSIALLQEGLSPAEIVKKITDEDPGRESRQVAVIDIEGRTGVFTSDRILNRGGGRYAGSIEGPNYSVQGNTLAGESVVIAMAAAYEAGEGKPMEERLMDALDAGNAEGGDARGMGSAGLLVVRPVPPDSTSIGRRVDLRVDHSLDNPFTELRRILNLRHLSRHYANVASELVSRGNVREALDAQKKAAHMNPTSGQLRYGLAERYADAGEMLNALLALREAVDLQGSLREEAATNSAFDGMREMVEFKRAVEQQD